MTISSLFIGRVQVAPGSGMPGLAAGVGRSGTGNTAAGVGLMGAAIGMGVDVAVGVAVGALVGVWVGVVAAVEVGDADGTNRERVGDGCLAEGRPHAVMVAARIARHDKCLILTVCL